MVTQNLSININGELLDFEKPRIMGILNVTPDSFYDGGKYNKADKANSRIKEIINQGADIIDVGAISSRPGANIISAREEWERLEPVLELIRKQSHNIPVSLDTFRSEIANKAFNNYRIDIINDISAGEMDNEMFDFIAEKKLPYIIMHIKGKPENMQENPEYDDLMKEIIDYFHKKIYRLKEKGITDIIVDPGFGFGKTIDHNYQILKKLNRFKIFGQPVLAGLSRKSMISKYLNIKPEESLYGTNVLHTLAITKGANILRVHDILQAKHVCKLVEKTNNSINTDW